MDMQKYIWNVTQALELARKHGGMSLPEQYRFYGALECALIVVGVLEPGCKFERKKVDVVDDYIFFKRRYSRQEYYGEMIERLADEWLAKPENKTWFIVRETGEQYESHFNGK